MLHYNMETTTRLEAYVTDYQSCFSKTPFYPTSFGRFSCGNQYYTERDNFAECLILYTLEGEGYLKYHNREVVIPQNCVAVIDCRDYHYYANRKSEQWDFLWIHFSGKCASDYVKLVNEEGLRMIRIFERRDFQQAFGELAELQNSTDAYIGLSMSEVLNRILTRLAILSQHDHPSFSTLSHRAEIEQAVSYIRQNYNKPLTVDELAPISSLSKYYFIKVFRKITGTTPYRFLNTVRINQAKRMLLETDLSINEIASAIGFSDVKNFISAFKKEGNITPLQFRKTSIGRVEEISLSNLPNR